MFTKKKTIMLFDLIKSDFSGHFIILYPNGSLMSTRFSDRTMEDLAYHVERPQYIDMTTEDCSSCLKNFSDPIMSSTACYSDDEVEELMEAQSRRRDVPEDERKTNCRTEEALKSLVDSIYNSTVTGSGKIQAPLLEKWLSDNFMEQEDVSIARSEMYKFYRESCQFYGETPCNQATFGKVIRVVFPDVRTRRIGVRGQSRYHYYGIGPAKKIGEAINSTSHRSYIKHGDTEAIQRFSSVLERLAEERPEGYGDIDLHLTGFPTIWTVPNLLTDRGLAHNFLLLYKDHSIRLIATLVAAEFQKFKDRLLEFWTNIPVELFPLFNQPEFLEVLEQCDFTVYFVINDILVPQVPALTSKGMVDIVTNFIHSMRLMLTNSLIHCPDCLKVRKMSAYHQFQKNILKQLQINSIYTLTCILLQNQSVTSKLSQVWEGVDKEEVVHRISSVTYEVDRNKLVSYMNKIQDIFSHHGNITDQLLLLVHCVLQNYWREMYRGGQHVINPQSLVLCWSYITGQIIQLICQHNSQFTGLFFLLDILLKDYLLFLIERQQ